MLNNKTKLAIFFLSGTLLLPNFLFLQALDIPNTTDPEVLKLTQEIKDYQAKLDDLQKQQQAYDSSLKVKRQEINNLSNQISILNNTVSKLQLEIKSTELETKKTQLEKDEIQLNIRQKEQEISAQKGEVGEILRNLDQQERQKNYLEVLVVKGDIGSFFKTLNELQTLESGLNNKLANLSDLKGQLEKQHANMQERETQLNRLADQMSTKTERLNTDKQVQLQILSKTKGQESNFQKLLAEVKAEQAAINSDIQNLEAKARKKLAGKGQIPNDQGFIWPTSSRNVSAYFHDPDYPYRNVMEHPAIDIGKTPQGTPIRAAKSGYVARVKFAGNKTYAYILLVHNDGLSTVYGHISKPYVKEDDFVVQGEVIGLSGGAAGSTGSGNLTTGPHLHFEVRNNGIPVDPLKYLP
jgi:murein DD-endopeptidase MepM/ murein hydrolase activator NlpD